MVVNFSNSCAAIFWNMKKTSISLLLLFFSLWAYGQHAIIFQQKDGQVARFSFTEKPVVTYANNEVVLTTTKTSVQYPIYRLQKIGFDIDWNTTDLKEVKVAEACFHFQGDALCISGDTPSSPVLLFNVKGELVKRYKTDHQGCATIPLQQLRRDLYIVKTNRLSFKFRKP